jgi:hypothetical protein
MHRIAEALDADLIVVGPAHRGPVGRIVGGDAVGGVLQG